MTERKPPNFDPDTEISDVDLDEENVRVHGERLTESRAEQLAAETLTKARRRNLLPGAKSSSGCPSY